MEDKEYLTQFNLHLSYLYSFARKINELDFAVSLAGEFRGAQDAGWATTITAYEVLEEIKAVLGNKEVRSKQEFRVILMLYCQLAEAGGVYETLKNIFGVVTLKPYLLWPFKELVRIKQEPKRIIGPNANATFRDLSRAAKDVGLVRLSTLLENSFRDDIRNGISHADYVIREDGLRLRKRNGGYAERLTFEEVRNAVSNAVGFFEIFTLYNKVSINSFNPAKKILGRLSENIPMSWTVFHDPENGSFKISTSSPGGETSPEYVRQIEINSHLGGKVLSLYTLEPNEFTQHLHNHILATGFDPNHVVMDDVQFRALVEKIEDMKLWDERASAPTQGSVLLASPWGFRWLHSESDFDDSLEKPLIDIDFA